mgnify:CR=1 FL=1
MKNFNYLFVMISILLMVSCQPKSPDINSLIENGEYTDAEKKIKQSIKSDNISDEEKSELQFKIERMNRIRKDFSKTSEEVLNYIKKYYPEVIEKDLLEWEVDGSLEYKIIDREKFYFNRAASNLFRINSAAREKKNEVDGTVKDNLDVFLESYLPDVLKKRKANRSTFFSEKRIRLNYSLSVNANAVPSGEVVKCWLPFPREKGERQKDVKLISINNIDYIISPDEYAHRTIYSEKVAEKDKPTEFKLSVEFTGVNELHELDSKTIIQYKKNSDEYKKFTAERPPHIVFTDRVKNLSREIVGCETNPILIVKRIFQWINDNIPWAGAREYSTIQNISDYCLTTGHGDCGIKTLTFITLARYNGIPARWESGLMLHPNNWNLHDWGEAYFEGVGWVPVDQSFGLVESDDEDVRWFFLGGNDAYHFIVNSDYAQPLFPAKIYPRSETIDFQRGEVEWEGGNLYFDQWDYHIDVEYLD